MTRTPMKIGAVSLGCDKNRVDTEKMLARLAAAGHRIVSSEDEADLVIINTCAFTKDAQREAVDEILSVGALKERRPDLRIAVTGCLPQRFAEETRQGFPEVDIFLGIGDYDHIVEAVDKAARGEKFGLVAGGDAYYPDRIVTTPGHYAYLKIAEGCSNHCTYCAIPSIRGKYRSETRENLLKEAEKLADDGVKELILVAQDVTRYGVDIYGKPQLIPLVKGLSGLGFDRLRLMYLEPEMVDDELIEFIATADRVCRYADIPLQHIDSEVLKRMNRHTDERTTRELVRKVRAAGITMRTSFISGFPGESRKAHAKLRDFIAEAEIDFAGIFGYSREEGTPADRMKGHLLPSVIRSRVSELRAVEEGVITRKAAAQKGNILRVVYEGIDYDRQCFYGRTERQAPDIDSVVLFTSDDRVDIGEYYNVEVTGADGIDLIGKTV